MKKARLHYADPKEVLLNAAIPRATRVRAMLDAQAFWFGILCARIRRQHPNLSERDIVLEMFAELERSDKNIRRAAR